MANNIRNRVSNSRRCWRSVVVVVVVLTIYLHYFMNVNKQNL